MLLSGSLPSSSAETASIICSDSIFRRVASIRLPRKPVTTISSRSAPWASCWLSVSTCAQAFMLSALATASESGLNLSGMSFRVDFLRALDLLIRAIAPSDVILGLRYR